MSSSPILVLHISGGMLGLLSGAAAMSFRKGSRRHRVAGRIFVISMLCMAAGAAYLAFMKHDMGNFYGGLVTFYLVTTAWLTARRREGETGIFDWAALLVALAMGGIIFTHGIQKVTGHSGSKDGVPAGMSIFLGSVILLAAAGDVRMLVRGGVFGTQRLARHLWRMCFALFIASGSFFLGPANRPLRLLRTVGLRQQVFAAVLNTNMLFLLAVLPLILLIFWVFRVRLANANKQKLMPRNGDVYLLPTSVRSPVPAGHRPGQH
jgi:uncharacterized membrane protein